MQTLNQEKPEAAVPLPDGRSIPIKLQKEEKPAKKLGDSGHAGCLEHVESKSSHNEHVVTPEKRLEFSLKIIKFIKETCEEMQADPLWYADSIMFAFFSLLADSPGYCKTVLSSFCGCSKD